MTGAITLTGQSPVAESVVEQAENGFGQGTDLISPFGAALMAATVAHGSMPMPVADPRHRDHRRPGRASPVRRGADRACRC